MLRSYQLESLNWLIESWYHGRNVILADEMGLGKTIQSIAFLNYLYSFQNMKGPFLVVAPLSTLQHWKRTVEDWSTMNCVLYYDVKGQEGRAACRNYEWFLKDISIKGTIVQTAELCKFNVLITSFEVFSQDMKDVLINLPFQHIIIDEAHRLKNQNAKILTSLKKLPCERILLLTGTPIQNNTAELWTLLNFIEPTKFYSSSKFLAEYGELNNAEQIENLHTVLKPYLLRRMKEDVEKSIPPLQETIIDIEMTNIQKTIYKALYENNKGMLIKGSGFNFNACLNNLEMQLRKCCNHPFLMKELQNDLTKDCHTQYEYIEKLINCSGKMILLDKLLQKIIKEDSKVLIFSQFTNMLVLMEDYLKYRGIPYEKIDGGVKAKERQNSIDRFNSPQSRVNVFLLSTKAGGVGINLTSANVVVIFDSDWNPQNDVQATARAHRIGQENEVKVYRLITTKTYESEMFERASKKLGLDQAIFMGANFNSTAKQKGEDDNLKKLSKAEIEILLKKGIMGLLEADNDNQQAMQDIDEIIKNSRVAKYSLINGTYTFSKSSYAAEQTDQGLQMNDPNFWGIVFKNTESECEKCLKRFNEREGNSEGFDLETQKSFMQELFKIFNKLIEAKIKVEGYSVDDENKLNEILTKITSHPQFHKDFKDFAYQMIAEIQKPSRRCKNIDITKLDISLDVKRPVVQRKKQGNNSEAKEEEDDNIYKENSDEEGNIFENMTAKAKDKMMKKRLARMEEKEKEKQKGTTTIAVLEGPPKAAEKKTSEKPTKSTKEASQTEQSEPKKKKKPTAATSSVPPSGEQDGEQVSKPKGRDRTKEKEDKTKQDPAPRARKPAAARPPKALSSKVVLPAPEQKPGEVTLNKQKYTFEQLDLESPSTVDYSLYNKDWCRYCGARYSSKFSSGPW
jgi:chromodomain-helicase-DNA-binding protein 7